MTDPEPLMTWRPSFVERNGELIAVILGATAFGFTLGMLATVLVI